MVIKVGDIFIISDIPFSLVKVTEISEQTKTVSLSNALGPCWPIWYPSEVLLGRKRATKKDWYKLIRKITINHEGR